MQQETGDQMESGNRKLDYGTPTDDDEVTLPLHDRATEVQDFPDTDICDKQTLLDTQDSPVGSTLRWWRTDHLWKPQGV